MAFLEHVWLAPNALVGGTLAGARSGTIFLGLEGEQKIIGHRPGPQGGDKATIIVDLETFGLRKLDEDEDGDVKGAIIGNLSLSVDPFSIIALREAEVGDLLSNGDSFVLMAVGPSGNPLRVAIGGAESEKPFLAYRGWQMSTNGTLIYSRPCIG